MKIWRFYFIGLISGILLLCGCSEEFASRFDPIPKALGLANEITVITDVNLWESPLKDTFEYYFQAAYPILPQPEPLFDLRHFTPKQLNQDNLRRELRTYLFLANLEDENSPTTQMILKDLGPEKAKKAKTDLSYNSAVGYDRWANGQLIIYLFGKNLDDLYKQVVKQFPAIAKKINMFDEEQIYAGVYLRKSSTKLNTLFQDNYSASIDLPADYFLAIHEGKTMWFRKETDFVSYNIMVTEYPYNSQKQLSKEGVKATRDSLGIKYVSTEEDGTFMKVNDVDLPMITEASNLGNSYAIETRGIWEIENDFMGGPFLNYTVLSPDKKRIFFLDGFVHAPSKEKRKYMQQLEVILSSFQFLETQ